MADVKQPRLRQIGGTGLDLKEYSDNVLRLGGVPLAENNAYLLGEIEEQEENQNVVELSADEQRYLEQLNMEVLYAQKAYFGFLNHLRRAYGCPEGEWAMNNINVGFERITPE